MSLGTISDKEEINGFYRGKVELRQDPTGRGKVKVRVPQFHGYPGFTEEFIHVEYLPWAEYMSPFGGGYDTGSFHIPPVGSWVWVAFEAGDLDKPIYLGGMYHKDLEKERTMGWLEESMSGDREIPESEDDIPVGEWTVPEGEHERPKDIDIDPSAKKQEPRQSVFFKSNKGHTIATDDDDEKESLSIIDRAGQIFKMISPIKEDVNRSGDKSFKRENKSCYNNDQFDYEEDSFQQKSVILIKDLAGQLIRTVAEYAKEKIEIVSRNKDKDRQSVAQLKSESGSVGFFLLAEDKNLNNRVYIEADASSPSLKLVVVQSGMVVSRSNLGTTGITHETTGGLTLRGNPLYFYPHQGIATTPFVSVPDGTTWEDGEDEKFVEE